MNSLAGNRTPTTDVKSLYSNRYTTKDSCIKYKLLLKVFKKEKNTYKY